MLVVSSCSLPSEYSDEYSILFESKVDEPISESKHLTTNRSLINSIQGMNCSLCIPFL
jgi:hypothetical protein